MINMQCNTIEFITTKTRVASGSNTNKHSMRNPRAPLDPCFTPISSSPPPLASIAKKLNPSAVEVVAVGRTADADRTPEEALALGRPSRSGLRSP